jgi:death-on-curing protein
LIGPADPYLERYTIGIHDVLEAHFLLVDFFFRTGEGVGGIGPKNIQMLHSALSRQFVNFGGKPKYSNRIDICATLLFGLVKNHPFHDANKRTGFLVSLLHLQKIGRTPIIPQIEYEDFVVDIADNNLERYFGWIDAPPHSPDREIHVISRFLKRSSRLIDTQVKTVTYNELKQLLAKRGLGLESPNGNRIDLVRYENEPTSRLRRWKRIAHIGFHGWSKEVSRKDIEIVRSASRLDATHGYDSQSFFNGLDGPLELIQKYREPLERLAFR